MDRHCLRTQCLPIILTLAVAVLATAGGCRSALTTAMYLVKGNNIEAEYDGLRDKKVVVVCRPVVDLTYRDTSVARDLAHEVSILLRNNVPKIKVVDQRTVDEWKDANTWEEYVEIGKALEADMVVGIDLENFTIFQGQTLYQGRSNAVLCVYDCSHPDQRVFSRVLPEVVYPPNAGIATSEKPEREFRSKFVRILADQIGRYFYAHDPHADYALDATALD